MELIVKKLSNINFETHNIRVLNKNEYQDEISNKMKSLKISKKKKKESDRFSVIFFNQNRKKKLNIDKNIINLNFSSIYLVNNKIPSFKKIIYSIDSLIDKLNIKPLYVNEQKNKNLFIIGISNQDKEKLQVDKRKDWKVWIDFIPGDKTKNIYNYLVKNNSILNNHVHTTNLNNNYDCNFPLLDVYKSMNNYTNNL